MKKLILLFLIIVLPVFSFAQDGANAKKPSVDGAKGGEDKTESSTENYKVDQTEENTKDNIKGESIELYDLINLLLPDEGEGSKSMKWESVNDITRVNWKNKFYDDSFKKFRKEGSAFITISGKMVHPEIEFLLEGDGEVYSFIWIFLHNAMGDLNIDKYIEQMKPVPTDILFPDKPFTSKLIKNNSESITLLEGSYEVKFPHKKTFWIRTTYSRGTRVEGLDIECYLNKNETNDQDHTIEKESNEIFENNYQSNELEFLRNMKDKYAHDVDLLNIAIINQRLKKLLGDELELIIKISELGPSTPIKVDNDIFSSNTCQQHNCYYTNYIIAADLIKNLLFVGIREEEKVKLYSEDESEIPIVLRDWVNNKY